MAGFILMFCSRLIPNIQSLIDKNIIKLRYMAKTYIQIQYLTILEIKLVGFPEGFLLSRLQSETNFYVFLHFSTTEIINCCNQQSFTEDNSDIYQFFYNNYYETIGKWEGRGKEKKIQYATDESRNSSFLMSLFFSYNYLIFRAY